MNFKESVLKGDCSSWGALNTLRGSEELLPCEIVYAGYEMVPGDPDLKIDPPPPNYQNAVRLLIELKTFSKDRPGCQLEIAVTRNEPKKQI